MLNKSLRILLITNGFILLAGAMLGPIYALFVEKVGGNLLDASIAGAIFALAAGITAFVSGRYADRIRENEFLIVLGYGMMGLGFLLYIFVDSVLFLFAVQVVIGFGEAIYSAPFDSVYSKHMSQNKAGSQWGAWELLSYSSTAIGAVVGGVIATYFGFTPLFIAMAALSFSSAVYIYFLPRSVL